MKIELNTPIRTGAIIATGIMLFGAIAYIIKFHNHAWSSSPEAWGQFGDYMNMYVISASLIIVSILTYVVYRVDHHRAIEQADAEKVRDRPIIVFQTEVNSQTKEPYWIIRNATDNVALNVLVTHSEQPDMWKKPIMIYTLGGRQEREMPWFRPAYQIRAVYYDVKGNVLTSTMQSDRMTVEPGINGLIHFKENEYRRYDEVIRGIG